MKIKIASWNVNGIRACQKKGFLDWFNSEKNHVVCLQETKASPEQLDESLKMIKNYTSVFSSAKKKGYSGTAIYFHKKLGDPTIIPKLGIKKFDDEGRTIIAEFEKFIIFCGYYPNGQRDHNRVPFKLEYSRAVVKKAKKLSKEKKKPVVLCGDFNTAHTEIDLKNPKSNKDSTGFLPIEREWIDELVSQNFIDIFREKHPEEEGHYTWWTYRGDCRQRNIGWRLDYFFISEELRKKTKKTYIDPKVMGSDHCPIVLELDL
ncbi:MAG: exodeoxyribonuclease III [Halobacteriovoraceae bacterium]|jgi:exodeoxyribonuclease III|nr:exodeoxyribonuclease III [Halobacteriovoraceae bacterium]MBT5093553.1 exodeoxyribonuclease III [Halobacteriovoraceae bacterium]